MRKTIQKNDPKTMNAWAFYDWANSVYSLVITTTIFPLYYVSVLEGTGIKLLGLSHEAIYSFSIGFSFLLVVILSPILSAIADVIGNKKMFLKIFCTLGSLSCAGLFFFTSAETAYIGLLCSIFASVGFWGSLVFYNSYLPDIATEEHHDSLSAKGFSLGYIGSALLLVICLAIIMMHSSLGLEESFATRICFLLVAVWWFGFAQYTIMNLPKGNANGKKEKNNIIQNSYKELIKVRKELFKDPSLKNFLLGFFCYSVGVQTIFYLAVPFGKNDLKIEAETLIIIVLVMQIVAIGGATLYSKLSEKKGNKFALQVAIGVWFLVCILGYSINPEYKNAEYIFYLMAALVALVMGGIQSLSRSTYSKLIPNTNDTTTYFSFFDVLEKIAIILGTFLIGLMIEQFGNMRLGVLSMALFFMLGMYFIRNFKK
ncbi:putative MFS-type transporter YxiO [Flavobacteriaceae bacterium UJ101]|nr:putative MFS-type transporter YxiO [Flavobacteriaceae bacterium UJ101]